MKTNKEIFLNDLEVIMTTSLTTFKRALENAQTGGCDKTYLEETDRQIMALHDFLYHLERQIQRPYHLKTVQNSIKSIIKKTWELDRYSGNSLSLTLSEKESKKLFPWSLDGHHSEEFDISDGISIYIDDGTVRICFHGNDNDDGIHSVDKSMASDDLCAAFVKKHNIKLNVSGILGPYKHAEDMLKKFGLI